MTPIRNLSDLTGHVTIRSAADALAFVRLRTSRRVFYAVTGYTGPRELDVLCRDEVTPDVCYGDTGMAGHLLHSPEGDQGIITATTARRLRLPRAQVTRTKDGFEVRRVLLSFDFRTWRSYLSQVTETVTTSGYYREIGRIILPATQSEGVEWIFPVFR